MERDEEETNKEVIGQGRRDSSSRFKCVHWDKRLNKWRARGTVLSRNTRLHRVLQHRGGCGTRAHQGYVEHGTLPARKFPTSTSRLRYLLE